MLDDSRSEKTPEPARSEATPLPDRLPPLFELGRVVATPAALEALRAPLIQLADLLNRHQRGDWGDLCAEDRAVNRKAAVLGYRLRASYTLPATGAKAKAGAKLWIITEADRSATTLLLPEAY